MKPRKGRSVAEPDPQARLKIFFAKTPVAGFATCKGCNYKVLPLIAKQLGETFRFASKRAVHVGKAGARPRDLPQRGM